MNSGEPALDAWLREQARGAQARRVARTFVWCADSGEVVAYYSLVGHQVLRDEVPRAIGRGSPIAIPAVLLARLALDRRLHGAGLGAVLLSDALGRAVAASQLVAARLVVVDAISEGAAMFYEHFGLRRLPATTRLFRKISDIANDLGD